MQQNSSFDPALEDRKDFEDAERGFIAALDPGVVKNVEGKVIWNIDAYSFMQEPCPETAHPYLWRQGQLNSKQGLYEIMPGIYQVRALDLSNMTIVEGNEGIIIIDPLISCECAAAGLALYQAHRGKARRVMGMIYSHSHGDHYMGAQGVLPPDQDMSIPIIAPEGFMEAVLSESIIAGPAMRKRGAYMYGNALPRGPAGQIGTGLGMGSSTGTTSLIPPNLLIQKTGEAHVIDGVRIVFQMVPGTEAPAEVNFYFPDFEALCIPETATNCMHNIVTLRGALVRDAKAWSQYLDEVIVLFGGKSNIMFGSHNWPSWSQEDLIQRLVEQRDMYGYLHDQTVRMMNHGMTGIEIAERMRLPPAISRAWHCRGFYGSVSHNVKGIYQRYMTWFDGDPGHLWQYPALEEGQRYVECMGGVEGLCLKAQGFMGRGDYRFAATLLAHAVSAFPEDINNPAKPLLATTYEQLGFGAENATWRNFYLTGAQQLRTGSDAGELGSGRNRLGPNLATRQWFEILSVLLDGERAAEKSFVLEFHVQDVREAWKLIVSNGVLIRRLMDPAIQPSRSEPRTDFKMVLNRQELLQVLRGQGVKCASQQGRMEVLQEFLELLSYPESATRNGKRL